MASEVSAPLYKYTAGAQTTSQSSHGRRPVKRRSTHNTGSKPKRNEAVVFDETSRREFLTGFRKRKAQRKELSKKAALEKEKNERAASRRAAREARKEKAAENVRAEHEAYQHDLSEGYEDDEIDSTNAPVPLPSMYETVEQRTTVTIQDCDGDSQEDTNGYARNGKPVQGEKRSGRKETLPPSSARVSKKRKNLSSQYDLIDKTKKHKTSTGKHEKSDSKRISEILEP